MRKYSKAKWTDRENELLLEYYHTCSMNALLAIFPDKSEREIRDQAAYLNRKNRKFRYLQ